MVNPSFDAVKRNEKGQLIKGSISLFKEHRHKESSKKLMSEKKIGKQTTGTLGKQRPPEIKQILKKYAYTSESTSGDKNPFFGQRHSIETKNIISEKAKQRWQNPEYRSILVEKIRRNDHKTPLRGKPKSKEHIQKLRESRKSFIVPLKDTKPERMLQIALSLEGIKFQKHKSFKIGKSYHQVDLFIEPNICVEVDGVHWHLPKKQLIRDLDINTELTIQGYYLLRIRDKDILKNIRESTIAVINLIKQVKYSYNLKVLV